MLSIVICDDDTTHIDILKKYLIEILEDLNMNHKLLEFKSGEELLENYPKKIDILFLDIQMKDLTGMDVARKIRKFDTKVEIIFTTAVSEYIHEGYEVRAYRYLLKPIKYKNLERHVKLCIRDLLSKNSTISIQSNHDTIVLSVDEILYAEVEKKNVTIHTENRDYIIEISMKKVEEKLLNHNFFRCHKSYLVNLKKINSIKDKIAVIKGNEIPVSRYKIKELKIQLANILGDVLC
ncbi:DNA-binding response regulator [Romboutsia maritimum]|uniref:Stage 0 sporulation protein A homolog n=1 Tax=Romboutsia maritimum TaxID=2020948 RepID=A0A371IR36_9FIRM|nr:LytTR family DNA-binding domain-containing protein [Romboutsia maritimum]RDY22945.1 DNA-binding response regulator [Romboutsia maritimum]